MDRIRLKWIVWIERIKLDGRRLNWTKMGRSGPKCYVIELKNNVATIH